MKIGKMNFVIAIIMLIIVAGCAIAPLKADGQAANKEAESIVTETITSTNEQAVSNVVSAPSYEITAETMTKLNAVLTPAIAMAVSEGSRKMSFGDSYVFAVAVGNPNIIFDNFQLKAELIKTYDRSMNSILSNKSYASSWIERNNFEIKKLNRGEQMIVPFIVEIKNLIDGAKPKPGVYEFRLTAMRQDNTNHIDAEHAYKIISIQIE